MNSLDKSGTAAVARKSTALPPPFRGTSERRLRGPVPESFEAFYRATLRYCSGARMRTLEVAQCYAAWAADHDAPQMNLRALKRAMFNIGHAHLKSNGMYFGDVQLAGDAPSLADNFPAGPPPLAAACGAVGRIDRICLELEQLRREVQAGAAR